MTARVEWGRQGTGPLSKSVRLAEKAFAASLIAQRVEGQFPPQVINYVSSRSGTGNLRLRAPERKGQRLAERSGEE